MIKPTTLITGSSDGIGLQIGLDLLDKNHYVIFTGRNPKPLLIEDTDKTDYEYHIVDFSNIESVCYFVKKLLNRRIDNLILNVGKTNREKNITVEDWDDVFNTNLKYPCGLIKGLEKNIQKRIIFIGSVLGHIPDSSSIAYGVSKGSLEILTKYLAKDFALKNVTVNTVAPGFTDTKWHHGKSKEHIKRIKEKILLKRFATTEEISHACQFIIENNYITGQTICVDGGYGL
jgi:3-oxoacyl-[acyl-carrier protein] reductase